MKGLIRLIFIFIFVANGCKDITQNAIPATTTNSESERFDSIKQKLIGKWGSTEAAAWEFKADSIFYLDRDSAYLYQLNGDTLLVKFPEVDTLTPFGKVNVIGDTLFLKQYYRDDFIVRAYRNKD